MSTLTWDLPWFNLHVKWECSCHKWPIIERGSSVGEIPVGFARAGIFQGNEKKQSAVCVIWACIHNRDIRISRLQRCVECNPSFPDWSLVDQSNCATLGQFLFSWCFTSDWNSSLRPFLSDNFFFLQPVGQIGLLSWSGWERIKLWSDLVSSCEWKCSADICLDQWSNELCQKNLGPRPHVLMPCLTLGFIWTDDMSAATVDPSPDGSLDFLTSSSWPDYPNAATINAQRKTGLELNASPAGKKKKKKKNPT